MVIGASYAGNLIASLSVDTTSFPFDTAEEMTNQQNFRYGTLGEAAPVVEFQVCEQLCISDM